MIDKILEKPVYLDRLKDEVKELISTIDTHQKPRKEMDYKLEPLFNKDKTILSMVI